MPKGMVTKRKGAETAEGPREELVANIAADSVSLTYRGGRYVTMGVGSPCVNRNSVIEHFSGYDGPWRLPMTSGRPSIVARSVMIGSAWLTAATVVPA